jgi:hypothetical protein
MKINVEVNERKRSYTRVLWKAYEQNHLVAKEIGEGNFEFNLIRIFVYFSKRYLTCRRILLHGIEGFSSHPKECVLRAFIARLPRLFF